LVAVHHDINDEKQTVKTVDVKVVKTDDEKDEALKGAEFTMYDMEGNKLDTQVTDKKGYAYFEIIEGEEVVLKETDVPEGYALDEPEYSVGETLEKEVIEVEVVNKRITGDLEIVKLDGSTNEKLKGAKFVVKDGDGEVVGDLETDKNGNASLEGLDYGEYTLEEVEAPKGYVRGEFEYNFDIKEYKEVVKVEVTNNKKEESMVTEVTKVTEDDEGTPPKEEEKESKEDVDEEVEQSTVGKLLPQTATDYFNWLLVGALMLVVGVVTTVYVRKKKNKVEETN